MGHVTRDDFNNSRLGQAGNTVYNKRSHRPGREHGVQQKITQARQGTRCITKDHTGQAGNTVYNKRSHRTGREHGVWPGRKHGV